MTRIAAKANQGDGVPERAAQRLLQYLVETSGAL
jgi:hypothetical protein